VNWHNIIGRIRSFLEDMYGLSSYSEEEFRAEIRTILKAYRRGNIVPALEALVKHLDKLIEVLDNGDEGKIHHEGEAFIISVQRAWELYNQGGVETEDRALTKVMYLFAKDELPEMLKDPRQHQKALLELRRFRRVMEKVLRPQEKPSGGQDAN